MRNNGKERLLSPLEMTAIFLPQVIAAAIVLNKLADGQPMESVAREIPLLLGFSFFSIGVPAVIIMKAVKILATPPNRPSGLPQSVGFDNNSWLTEGSNSGSWLRE